MVGGTILANGHGVMRPNMENGQAHQSGQANGWTHIIREHRKGGTGWAEDTVISNSVYDGTHGMFTDTKEEVASGMVVLGKISTSLM